MGLTLWSRAAGAAEEVAQESSMSVLLVGHELDEKAITWGKTRLGELLVAECGEDVMEEIELNPFLVETKKDGLVVKIGLDTVDWLIAASADTAGWLVGECQIVVQCAIGVVGRLLGVGWELRD